MDIQYGAHHHANRAGHPIRVVDQRGLVGNTHGVQVAGDARDQVQGRCQLHSGAGLQGQQTVGPRVLRAAREERVGHARQRTAGGVGVDGIVRQVVHVAAKRIERGGAGGMGSAEQLAGEEERSPMVAKYLARGARGVTISANAGGRGIHAGKASGANRARSSAADGSKRSTTLADDSTPGRPAPGWLPAPTR